MSNVYSEQIFRAIKNIYSTILYFTNVHYYTEYVDTVIGGKQIILCEFMDEIFDLPYYK